MTTKYNTRDIARELYDLVTYLKIRLAVLEAISGDIRDTEDKIKNVEEMANYLYSTKEQI
jgi:hypothetical protein